MLLHQFWHGSSKPYGWIDSVVWRCHPRLEIEQWTMCTLPTALRDRLDADEDPRHLSNLVRYWMLHEHGGLWLDHDVIPLTDLSTVHDQPWTASLSGTREGCVMWFPEAGHPMCLALFEQGLAAPAGRTPFRSGSVLLGSVGLEHPDVLHEPRVLPYNVYGRPTGVQAPLAVHLWHSTVETVRPRLSPAKG